MVNSRCMWYGFCNRSENATVLQEKAKLDEESRSAGHSCVTQMWHLSSIEVNDVLLRY